jgi:hypothetical protein
MIIKTNLFDHKHTIVEIKACMMYAPHFIFTLTLRSLCFKFRYFNTSVTWAHPWMNVYYEAVKTNDICSVSNGWLIYCIAMEGDIVMYKVQIALYTK